ncbi:MAG: hypothetical protein GY832_15080 [Chloroflexi bacterium]|nr:hypothetical protein [Chloroflexota bacterium]
MIPPPPDISGVTLIAPTGEITNVRPTFDWTDAADSQSGVVSYTLLISDSNSAVPKVVTTTTSVFTPVVDLETGPYTWTVKAHDAVGNASNYASPGATFIIRPLYTLTVRISPTLGGSVTLDPPGGVYTENTLVELTAIPAEGYELIRWSGDLMGTAFLGAIIMTQDMTITAHFETVAVPTYTLTVIISPTLGGTVTPNPPGLVYDENTPVELTANPADGYEFIRWSGDLTGTVSPDTITMTRDMTVTAAFDLLTYTLTVTTTGNGTGTVDLVPAGGVYDHGTGVTLTATANPGSYFGGWTGDLLTADSIETLVMDGNKQVTATFGTEPPVTYTLTVQTVGSGTVDPAGGTYISGTVLNLRATPDAGWQFAGWSGGVISEQPGQCHDDGGRERHSYF